MQIQLEVFTFKDGSPIENLEWFPVRKILNEGLSFLVCDAEGMRVIAASSICGFKADPGDDAATQQIVEVAIASAKRVGQKLLP
jgi:hypothetical protein